MNHLLGDNLLLLFDGLCEPRNPGGFACYGWLIKSGDAVVASGHGLAARNSTNNFAEYAALGFGLRWLTDRQWSGKLKIMGDSKLVVEQITQRWNCNKEHLQKLRARCWELLAIVGEWEITWHPREQNEEADALSRQAYVEETGQQPPERTRRK